MPAPSPDDGLVYDSHDTWDRVKVAVKEEVKRERTARLFVVLFVFAVLAKKGRR